MVESLFYAGCTYESPAVCVLAVCSEGILCSSEGSYGSTVDELLEEDFDWSDN